MRLRDLYRMAKENLMRRKLRTSLTILSIVIGTVSIILMIALGTGMQEAVLKEFDSYGSLNVLEVFKRQERSTRSRFYEKELVAGLTDADLLVMEEIPGVELAVPLSSALTTIFTSKHYTTVNIIGIDPVYMKELGFVVTQGRVPRDNVCELLFGDAAIKNFLETEDENPNAIIRKRREKAEEEAEQNESGIVISFGYDTEGDYPFKPLEERYKLRVELNLPEESKALERIYSASGVGVLKEGDIIKDNNIYMPLTTLERIVRSDYEANGLSYKSSYSEIMVKVTDTRQVQAVKKIIEDKGYDVFSLQSVLESVNNTIEIMKLALGAIGGISLLVAGIGITNTMVMAITERKKEIGIMKVIGATFIDIKRLFLLEAAMIGLFGGGIGLGLCILISNFINSDSFQKGMLGLEESNTFFTISSSLIIGGLIFTTMIGVISGYLPALKAMKSSALEAIRNE